MSISRYGTMFHCDLCRATARGQAEGPAGVSPWDEPVPEGWTTLRYLGLRLADVLGSEITHLCRACSALSIGDLAKRMMAQAKETKGADRGRP